MKNKLKKVVIIGLGLIGGSIVLKLKSANKKISIFSISKKDELFQIPKDTDLIVLATPIGEIIKLLQKLELLGIRSLIIDTGSTKKTILDIQQKYAPKLRFIGTHPLAGSEKSGIKNADENLFKNKFWAICPSPTNQKNDLRIVEKFVQIMEAKPFLISAEEHDRVLSRTSHISLILSSVLIQNLVKVITTKRLSSLITRSFDDLTRTAIFPAKLKTDIVLTNKENILNNLDSLLQEIKKIKSLINNEEEDELNGYFNQSRIFKNRLFQ